MKLDCGPSAEDKYEAKQQWHQIFALWPRRVGPNTCIWLAKVWRKGEYYGDSLGGFWQFEYSENHPVGEG